MLRKTVYVDVILQADPHLYLTNKAVVSELESKIGEAILNKRITPVHRGGNYDEPDLCVSYYAEQVRVTPNITKFELLTKWEYTNSFEDGLATADIMQQAVEYIRLACLAGNTIEPPSQLYGRKLKYVGIKAPAYGEPTYHVGSVSQLSLLPDEIKFKYISGRATKCV